MRLTMPQIILLNHGAWVNSERNKQNTDKPTKTKQEREGSSGMTSEQTIAHLAPLFM